VRLARAVTEALAPTPVATGLLATVAWRSSGSPREALRWGGVAVLFGCAIPFGHVLRQARRGLVTDRHVGRREQRPRVLLLGLGSVTVGLALLGALGAPAELRAVVGAGAASLLALLAITLRWKISGHSGVLAGAVAALSLLYGPRWLALAPLVPLVGWSRVALGDHTPAQVMAGVVVATATTSAVLRALPRPL
jgi:membrane-associated phospholipid phosphatase